MRRITKVMLTLALVFAGVGGIKAERVYANPSNGTQTWTAVSNTFTWTATSNNFINTGLPTGDISAYTNFHCTVSNFSENVNFIRLVLKNGKDNQITEYINAGEFNIDLVSKYTTWDFTCVTDFLLFGSNGATEGHSIDAEHPASAVVTDIYLEKPNSFVFDAFGKASINKTGLTATGGLSYDPSTGLLTSNGTEGTLTLELANPTDLRNVFHFNVSRSGSDNIVDRLLFYDEYNNLINTWNSIKWSNTWNANGIDDNATNAFLNHNPVKKLVWVSDAEAAKASLSLTITSVEFTLKTISCAMAGETQLNTLDYYFRENNEAEWGKVNPAWNVGSSTDTYYGDGSSKMTHYVDVTDYSEIRIYRDSETAFRAWFFTGDGSTGSDGALIDKNSTDVVSWNSNYYSIDLSKITKFDDKVWLIAIKSASWGVKDIVKNIVAYKVPAANAPQYILTGSGMQLAETVAALADATATCIDATGVTGITTNSEAGRTLLTSANPNCLFLGTTGNGGLANTQNVITSDACTNFALSDGNPFKAPATFTSTAAPTYNRTFTAGTVTTVCLPFALTEEEARTLGTFYELSSFDGSSLHFASQATPAANKAYIVVPTNSSLSLETGKSIATTPADLGTAITNVDFIGTLESTTIPASDATDSYFAYNNGSLVKIETNAATLPAFRGYFKVKTSAISGNSARSLGVIFDESSGISTITNAQEATGHCYDLQGRRISQPTKGLYIVNGKKIIK